MIGRITGHDTDNPADRTAYPFNREPSRLRGANAAEASAALGMVDAWLHDSLMRTGAGAIVLTILNFTLGSACAQTIDFRETRTSGDAAHALAAGDYARTIDLANKATALEPKDPWPYYDRASALVGLHRTDEAVATFKQAEALFDKNPWGRAISIWGRARAYRLAGNCDLAAPTFHEYTEAVRDTDEAGASLAMRYARECPARSPPVMGGGPKSR
jgi:tetratricopeptide (TPR) repeat protein